MPHRARSVPCGRRLAMRPSGRVISCSMACISPRWASRWALLAGVVCWPGRQVERSPVSSWNMVSWTEQCESVSTKAESIGTWHDAPRFEGLDLSCLNPRLTRIKDEKKRFRLTEPFHAMGSGVLSLNSARDNRSRDLEWLLPRCMPGTRLDRNKLRTLAREVY